MSKSPSWIVVGAIVGFLGVALGAFGAHGLAEVATPERLAWWETGVRYHLVHAPVLLFLGLWSGGRAASRAGWLFLVGILVFSGTLYGMALGLPRWLGAVTPLGGLALLGGWALLAWAGRRAAQTQP